MRSLSSDIWLDVGGTFTDCVARRDNGGLLHHKVLSSGVTKGLAGPLTNSHRIVDPARSGDPPEFWVGYRARWLDPADGQPHVAQIVRFDRDPGVLWLAEGSPEILPPKPLRPGQGYELESGEEAPLLAIRWLCGLKLGDPVPPLRVRLGTTRGTNALLTRRGARSALVTTRGFGDVLLIGNQDRPRLFDLDIVKAVPLHEEVLEVNERLAADGQVMIPLDPDEVRRQLAGLRQRGIESLAICLLHGATWPAHETMLLGLAEQAGFACICTSHRTAPLVKLVPRAETTLVDAYLNPVLQSYLDRLREALPTSDIRIMTSAGGLVAPERFSGKDSILSGPAAGAVGFAQAARAAGFERSIGFDMGGTSTDVARDEGQLELEYETVKAGVRLFAPQVAVETIAAGGGSICGFDGTRLTVGPESGGADPGPACYGRRGPACITDMNVMLGRIRPESFPFPLDLPAVERAVQTLSDNVAAACGHPLTPPALAAGYLRVATAQMAKAIRRITIAKGRSPHDFALVAFGGAAGQHACAVARELGIRTILSHPAAGVLSAVGIGLAETVRHDVLGVYQDYSAAVLAALEPELARREARMQQEMLAEGLPANRLNVVRTLDLRYRGLDACLTVAASGAPDQTFAVEHQARFGFRHPGRTLELVAVRLEFRGDVGLKLPTSWPVEPRDITATDHARVWFDGAWHATALWHRERLVPGDRFQGPAIVCEALATTVLEAGWQAEMRSQGELVLTDLGSPPMPVSAAADPVQLEVFNQQFAGIAEQMGVVLRNTASSVNVKERLDFSCALFTGAGDLVVNAPHIPVHLGAMGETVRALRTAFSQMRPGDVLLTNDPYQGGSHLPDVTVVTPVFVDGETQPAFFTASRAHHAEIGGIRPGSMPPFSTCLAEEGIVLPPQRIVIAGQLQESNLIAQLTAGAFPSRSPNENLADVRAQIAANQQGAQALLALAKRSSLEVVRAYMQHIQEAARRKSVKALARLPEGERTFVDHLDDGSAISVRIQLTGEGDARRALFDFTGSGPVHPGNLNANRAIVTAAAMYCLRLLIAEDIPLNQGVLLPLTLCLPECLLSPMAGDSPERTPAVVGGNVETSQRVVDTILGALDLAAASQGTMNNLLFGDATFGYYETICGGSGATARRAGADAVHTHMTNTRLTDPEVLERRFPVRLWRFTIRPGSGGAGQQRGGDGTVREFEFLRPLAVSILSQRRGPYAPYGKAGGEPGSLGRNTLLRARGLPEVLAGAAQFQAEVGDRLVIETPGGGGWGEPRAN